MAQSLASYNYKVLTQDLLQKLPSLNISTLPRFQKIVLHASSNQILREDRNIFYHSVSLQLVSGRFVKNTRAHKSIAGFQLRENQILGVKITLRGLFFFQMLLNIQSIALGRDRQFRGLSVQTRSINEFHTSLQDLLAFLELEKNYELFHDTKKADFSIISESTLPKLETLLISGLQICLVPLR